MNAGLNAYVMHMVPLVHAISSPISGNNTELVVGVQNGCLESRSLPLCPLQHMRWTLFSEASSNISGLGSL